MTQTDKTGAPVTVLRQPHAFSIAVEGKPLGLKAFTERDGQRVFYHTEVDDAFGGRGLATVLIAEALAATRADGLRIVAVCPTVAAYVKKHHEFETSSTVRPRKFWARRSDKRPHQRFHLDSQLPSKHLTVDCATNCCRVGASRGTVIRG